MIAALVLAGFAAPVGAQNFGDLVVGFATGSGPGAGTNIEVDMGSVNAFSSASLAPGTYAIGNLGADLSATYGPSWTSDSALTFAIAGVNSITSSPTYSAYDAAYAKSTVWASAAESAPGMAATPYVGSLGPQQSGAITNVSGMLGLSAATEGFALGSSLSDLTGTTSGVGTMLDAISIGTSALGAWTQAGGNVNFNFSNVPQDSFQQTVSAKGASVEIFDIAPTLNATSTDIQGAAGHTSFFTLNGNGMLTFTVVPSSAGGNPPLINISTRSLVGSGSDVQIAGFVISGTQTKTVLIRASGPALSEFGVTSVLPDPTLTLFSGQTVVATNTGWGTARNAADISAMAAAVGAFSWANASADSALLITLQPGAYTAQVSGSSGDTGVALVEVYDCAPGIPGSELENISTRSSVGTGGNIQIAGFVIGGSQPRTVLIRASGPALSGFGVEGVLADPKLALLNGQTVLASNTGWSTADNESDIVSAAVQVGAFPWEGASADSAILITLQPGTYTAEVSGSSGDSGVALIEVYDAGAP